MHSDNSPSRPRRFVIDLNQAGATATGGTATRPRPLSRSRRGPRLLLILGTVLLLIAAVAAGGVYFWWQYYKTTPAYSLALLMDASQNKDTPVVEQIIDTNQIVDSLAPRISQKTVARYGATLNSAKRKRVEAMVPALLPKVKEGAGGILAKWAEELFDKSEAKPFVVLALGLPYLVNIAPEGDTAKVTAPMKDRNVEFVMRRSGERWKIVGINDDAVVDRIVDNIISQFPAIGQVQ